MMRLINASLSDTFPPSCADVWPVAAYKAHLSAITSIFQRHAHVGLYFTVVISFMAGDARDIHYIRKHWNNREITLVPKT